MATSFNPATCSIQKPTEQTVETSLSAAAPLHAEPACHVQNPVNTGTNGPLGDAAFNTVTSVVGSQFVTAVQAEPNYAGTEAVDTGLMLSIVGSVTPAETTAITSAEKLARRQLAALSPTTPPPPFSITIRKVCYTLTELSNIDGAASEDPILAAHGITVSSGGPDTSTNSVDEWLDPYNAKVATALRAKYGTVVHIPPRTIGASGS